MILRTATSAAVVHAMPAHERGADLGFIQIRPTARIDAAAIEITWDAVPEAVMTVVRHHWAQYRQRGIPFQYGPPTVTLGDAWYQYDDELSIQRGGAGRISMRTTVRQTLTHD